MNQSFCNECKELVPAARAERDGKIFLVKKCPKCGDNDTLISSDAARYNKKRSLDMGYDYHGCGLNCQTCRHSGRAPSFAFVDVTNLCNMDCPICCDNVPSMGFKFNPPLEYFDKLFGMLAEMDPLPTVALFGGEPTARRDLLDIIALSRSHGLTTRVVTNGLKLADKDYCDNLLKSRARILLSYDGANPETYVKLRGTATAMKPKQEAIENITNSEFVRRGKVMLISCIAKGVNDQELPDLIDFYHSKRSFLTTVHLMPLAHTWESYDAGFEPERITTECIEDIVQDTFPGHEVEFVPAGFLAQFSSINKYIGTASMPFLGAHPNCESVALLVSNGEKYVPISHYLKRSMTETGRRLLALERRVRAREEGCSKGFGRLLKPVMGLVNRLAVLRFMFGHVRFGRMFRGRGLGKLCHAVALPFSTLLHGRREALRRHMGVEGALQLIILPFEDNYVIETERLERCPNLHVYLDPATGTMKHVPVCAWRLYNRTVMRSITEHYEGEAAKASEGGSEAVVAAG